MKFAEDVLVRRGVELSPPAIRRYLDAQTRRVFEEYARSFQQTSSMAPHGDRGLSSDTTWLPNFAVDRALAAIAERGLFRNGVSRVGLIGPGLDFADKRDGHDFYPVQSIQPFAVLDLLARLGLAGPQVGLWALDLNQRTVRHLESARQRGQRGEPYTLVLLRDLSLPWRAEVIEYWGRFGEQVGQRASSAGEAGSGPGAGSPGAQHRRGARGVVA